MDMEDVALLKLNLGCGDKHMDGWVNVDFVADCNPPPRYGSKFRAVSMAI